VSRVKTYPYLTDPDAPLTDEQKVLMEENIKLIWWYVGKYGAKYPSLDQEDMQGICTDAYIRAIQNYDPSKGKIAPYITSYMWGKLGNHFDRQKEKYVLLDDVVKVGTWENMIGSAYMESESLDNIDAGKVIDSFVDYGLTPKEIETVKWCYYYDGCRDRRNLVGKQMGISGYMVNAHSRSVKKKLEPHKEEILLAISG